MKDESPRSPKSATKRATKFMAADMRRPLTEIISTTSRQAKGGAGRRLSNARQDPRVEGRRTCAHCGWSWAAGSEGALLCLNPESPHGYDVVPAHLTCAEQEPNPEQG